MQSDVESDADEGGGMFSASEDEEVARRWQEGSAAGDLEIPVPDFGLGVRPSQTLTSDIYLATGSLPRHAVYTNGCLLAPHVLW